MGRFRFRFRLPTQRDALRSAASKKANTLAILLASVALGLAGAALAEEGKEGAKGEGATVRIGHNRIEPAEVTVGVGEPVTFLNEEKMPGGHTIGATDGSFSSPPLDLDQSWEKSFEEPGTYEFRIEEHPEATGTIVVE